MTLAKSNGQVLVEFLKMRIKHPRLDEAHQLYDDLRHAKRSCPNEPQRFGALFADPQSGKTMSVKTYIETRVVDDAVERCLFPAGTPREEIALRQRIVLHVTLSAKATPKSLATDILNAFGDDRASKGTAQSLLQRAYAYMRHFGTELVYIDEIQHLSHQTANTEGKSARSGLVESTATTDTLKTMLLHGLVPMMFIGIPEARHQIFNDTQLAARCVGELNFGPLEFSRPAERKIFVEYCGRLGLKLRRHGLFEEETDLVSDELPACIHEVAKGRLGMASNLILAASKLAREQNAKRLLKEHVEAAIDEWAIPMGIIDYNPMREGIRSAVAQAA